MDLTIESHQTVTQAVLPKPAAVGPDSCNSSEGSDYEGSTAANEAPAGGVRMGGMVWYLFKPKISRMQTGGQVCNPLQGHTNSVMSVAFSPDGRYIVSGPWDRTICIWDAQTGGQVCNPLQEHTNMDMSVAFSPDGRHIASGSWDNTICIWDAQTGGQACNPLQGHIKSVNSVAFSPDGRYIVSGSLDKTI